MNMEISGHDYPLYHGGEEQGKTGPPEGKLCGRFGGSKFLVWERERATRARPHHPLAFSPPTIP